MTVKAFALAIKAHRARTGLTQPQAAEILDISPRTLAGWEAGTSPKLAQVTMEGALTRLERVPKVS